MSSLMEREKTDVATTSVDPKRVVEYGYGKEFVLREELFEHLESASATVRRRKEKPTGLPLVIATMRRIVRLHESVDQSLLFDLMVYARFKLGLHRGQLGDLCGKLNDAQLRELKAMTIAGNLGKK